MPANLRPARRRDDLPNVTRLLTVRQRGAIALTLGVQVVGGGARRPLASIPAASLDEDQSLIVSRCVRPSSPRSPTRSG